MADFGIKPDLPLQAVPQKRTSISDLLGTATKAMEFSRLSELYPELIRKTKAEAAAAETGAAKAAMGLDADKAAIITAGTVSLMFNELVVDAAAGRPVDKNALTNLVMQRVMTQSKNAGIDYETEGKRIAAEYLAEAENNPAGFQQYLKERMFADLDKATRAEKMTPSIVTQGLPKPGLYAPAEGVVRELPTTDQEPQGGQPLANQLPAGQPPAVVSIPARCDCWATYPTYGSKPWVSIELQTAPPEGSMRPVTEPEQAAIDEGRKFRETAAEFSDQGPGVIDRVDRVLQTVAQIESNRDFKAGKLGELEAQYRQLIGEQEYKLLQKELADLVIQTNQVTGGKTDAATALVAQSTGDTSYPPGVLKNVVTKLRGDAYGAMMKAQGAQAFLNNGYGEANLRNYRDAWTKNADPRVFEAMAIFDSDRLSADEKKKAFEKIRPANLQSLGPFEQKYLNIESLRQTGALPSRDAR
jgi:hypothetical protein